MIVPSVINLYTHAASIGYSYLNVVIVVMPFFYELYSLNIIIL